MSIVIKGIEMPTDGCKDCIFVNRTCLGDICPFLKREVTGHVERGGFQTDCPLVPVPPHGDLIDRDEQIERAWRLTQLLPVTRELIETMLKTAPTILEAEEGET